MTAFKHTFTIDPERVNEDFQKHMEEIMKGKLVFINMIDGEIIEPKDMEFTYSEDMKT